MSADLLIHRLRGTDDGPLLCLDYLHYARKVFGQGQTRWIDGAVLLSLYRQAQPALGADVILFPLLDWIAAWWRAEVGESEPSERPIKALRAVCNHAPMVAALGDVLDALNTLNGARATIGLLAADPGNWMAWASGDGGRCDELDEMDVEDVASCLSALIHQVTPRRAGALFIDQRSSLSGDAGRAFEPLTNTATHYDLASVYCHSTATSLPNGFDCFATSVPMAGAGLILSDGAWSGEAPLTASVPFVVGVVPEEIAPARALATVSALRATSR